MNIVYQGFNIRILTHFIRAIYNQIFYTDADQFIY